MKINLKDFIKLMFEDPHFSRADVACDIINLDDEYVNQYRLVDAVSFVLTMDSRDSWRLRTGAQGHQKGKSDFIINELSD